MFEGKRVLTVDDSATIRVFLRSLLQARGAVVEEAGSGEEAIALWRSGKEYDLVILDLLLPDSDGISLLQFLRRTNDDSAVVMLTGMGGIKSAMAAVQKGADGYIEKQDLSVGGDSAEFFYALEQAMNRRDGIVAQKQLQQVKADFYSMVTHDLRNPAGVISLSLNLLLGEEAGPLTPDQRELAGMAQAASNKMLGLINDYLDYAKIDAGYLRLDLSTTDLCEVVQSCSHLAAIQAKSRQHTLSIDLPPEPLLAQADGERLKQVIDNLLSNAIKYTPEGGQISVKLTQDTERDQVVFRISDTGRGIPKEQLPMLFTKYHRVPGQATRGIKGTGLGLLIVKEIVAAHGGNIQVDSEGVPGRGTTFVIRIPLHAV
ncbi:MAG: hybrid sensor histidine kinase/response regulator [Chloroflexi bacterium]|nr:hybrid sensor histidine kinase/response regulator [Chloroflexota bacterium]